MNSPRIKFAKRLLERIVKLLNVQKKHIYELNKCYSIALFEREGMKEFLVAAEKHDACLLFDETGNKLETVWTEPGGVMTMVQVPGRDDQFLATQRFYSPNDSSSARIVVATRIAENNWDVRTLCKVPFVHRFDIIERSGVRYLFVCCLKSGHSYENDWTQPGAVYFSILPENLNDYDELFQIHLTKLKDDMCHNHGYSSFSDNGVKTGIVACDSGVWKFTPPTDQCTQWDIRQLYNQPVSDAVVADFDGDGALEIGCIAPFHGNNLYVCKQDANGVYRKIWEYEHPLEMLHASWVCKIDGRTMWFVGHRKGARDLLCVSFENGVYKTEIIDHDVGSANVCFFVDSKGRNTLISANRETNEIALYYLSYPCE